MNDSPLPPPSIDWSVARCLAGYGWPFCVRLCKAEWLLFILTASTFMTHKKKTGWDTGSIHVYTRQRATLRSNQWQIRHKPDICPIIFSVIVGRSLSLYRINLISVYLNPSLKNYYILPKHTTNSLLEWFASNRDIIWKIKVIESNTPLPQRIRLKTPFPCIYFHPSWAKIPWSAEKETSWNGSERCRRPPHQPTVELKSAHTVRSPYKGRLAFPLCSVSYFKDNNLYMRKTCRHNAWKIPETEHQHTHTVHTHTTWNFRTRCPL